MLCLSLCYTLVLYNCGRLYILRHFNRDSRYLHEEELLRSHAEDRRSFHLDLSLFHQSVRSAVIACSVRESLCSNSAPLSSRVVVYLVLDGEPVHEILTW